MYGGIISFFLLNLFFSLSRTRVVSLSCYLSRSIIFLGIWKMDTPICFTLQLLSLPFNGWFVRYIEILALDLFCPLQFFFPPSLSVGLCCLFHSHPVFNCCLKCLHILIYSHDTSFLFMLWVGFCVGVIHLFYFPSPNLSPTSPFFTSCQLEHRGTYKYIVNDHHVSQALLSV